MTYRFTDYDGEGLSIKRDEEGEGLRVDKFGEGFVWVNNHEAPRVALEILKAAGYGGEGDFVLVNPVNTAVVCLEKHIENTERDAKEAVTAKRRDELARELDNAAYNANTSILTYHAAKPNLRVAIDRIIELEQATP